MSTSMSTASSSSPTKTESSNLQDPRLISVSELDKVFDIQNDFRAIRDSIHTIDSFMVTEPENSHRPAPARRLFYWKMDFYVLPVLGMMLALVALDQTTFRAFRLSGIEDKLSLSDKQYKMSLTLTYIPFVVSPYPLNLMLRRLGPNYVLPGIIVLCGVIILSTGFVKSYEALLACRFLLGLFEGGLLPGIGIHLTSLYPRHKLAFRFNLLVASAFLGYAFSGILAYGITHMDRVANLSGWSWTFILEGIFTILFGIVSIFLVPRTIEDVRFLNKQEKRRHARVLYQDDYGHHQTHQFSFKEVLRAFMGIHVWFGGVMSFTMGAKLAGVAYLLRTAIDRLNYTSPSKAQLMTIPPYAAALGVALFVGYASDYFAVRGVSIGLCNILTIIGLGIYFGSQVHLVRYGCLIIVISGSLSVVGLITAWVANNAFPYIRRASALAISGMAFGMGLIMMVWLAGNIGRDTMTVVLLALAAAEGMISIVNTVWLRWKNEMMNCMREDDRYGDDSKWFMYTL